MKLVNNNKLFHIELPPLGDNSKNIIFIFFRVIPGGGNSKFLNSISTLSYQWGVNSKFSKIYMDFELPLGDNSRMG